MNSKTNHYLEQQRINVIGRTVPEFWNLNKELAKEKKRQEFLKKIRERY